MPDQARHLIRQHWLLANARDWDAFARLLAPDLVYEVPQTRERAVGAAGYLDLFKTWPQPWRAEVQQLVAEADRVVCIIEFVTEGAPATGIGVFELQGGRISRVTDYWPDPYEPPPRQTPHLQRF